MGIVSIFLIMGNAEDLRHQPYLLFCVFCNFSTGKICDSLAPTVLSYLEVKLCTT